MYRNFRYISYVCVFTGALLVGSPGLKEKVEAVKLLCLFVFIPSSPCAAAAAAVAVATARSSSVCIPF